MVITKYDWENLCFKYIRVSNYLIQLYFNVLTQQLQEPITESAHNNNNNNTTPFILYRKI
jgi:hypothetical protein